MQNAAAARLLDPLDRRARVEADPARRQDWLKLSEPLLRLMRSSITQEQDIQISRT